MRAQFYQCPYIGAAAGNFSYYHGSFLCLQYISKTFACRKGRGGCQNIHGFVEVSFPGNIKRRPGLFELLFPPEVHIKQVNRVRRKKVAYHKIAKSAKTAAVLPEIDYYGPGICKVLHAGNP